MTTERMVKTTQIFAPILCLSSVIPNLKNKWRRDRDLNPRYATNVCRFSRPVLSTTQPSLRSAMNTTLTIIPCKALIYTKYSPEQ